MASTNDKTRIYFIIAPLLAALWPVWLLLISLPAARTGWENDEKHFTTSRANIEQILTLDPERLEALAEDGRKAVQFTYPVAINNIAKRCKISPSSYSVKTMPPVKPATGQATQNAAMTLDKLGIQTLAQFVSLAELTYYPSLKCTQLSLTKYRDEKDQWRSDMTFTYYE